MRISTPEEFWAALNQGEGCWTLRGRETAPYPAIEYCDKKYPAHRLAWVLTHGEILDGLFVCHQCDNRSCARPGHLFLGTSKANTLDAKSKKRMGRRSHLGPAPEVALKDARDAIIDPDGDLVERLVVPLTPRQRAAIGAVADSLGVPAATWARCLILRFVTGDYMGLLELRDEHAIERDDVVLLTDPEKVAERVRQTVLKMLLKEGGR